MDFLAMITVSGAMVSALLFKAQTLMSSYFFWGGGACGFLNNSHGEHVQGRLMIGYKDARPTGSQVLLAFQLDMNAE